MLEIKRRYRLTTGALVARLIFCMSFQGSFAFCALINYSMHDWFWTGAFTGLTIVWTGVVQARLKNWKNY